MARTPSNMFPLGELAPEFCLPEPLSGNDLSLSQLKGSKATVVMFICNHCPFVKHIFAGLVALGRDYQSEEVGIVAISSNDVSNYPEDAPDNMAALAQELGFTFPYLYDQSQDVAKAYDAACTPDFYLFDAGLRCVYRGRMDEATPGNDVPVTAKDLRAAIDATLAGKQVNENQYPSIGCNIKWK